MATYIQLNQWADDSQNTKAVYISEADLSPQAVLRDFCNEYGLTTDDNKESDLELITELFESYIKALGFKKLKMLTVLFSD